MSACCEYSENLLMRLRSGGLAPSLSDRRTGDAESGMILAIRSVHLSNYSSIVERGDFLVAEEKAATLAMEGCRTYTEN